MNAQQEQVTHPPYRPNPSPALCPDCLGNGAFSRPSGLVGGPPQTFVCRECGGTGRPAA